MNGDQGRAAQRIIADHLGVDEDTVQPDVTFKSLGADDIDAKHIRQALEAELEFHVPAECASLGDVLGLLERRPLVRRGPVDSTRTQPSRSEPPRIALVGESHVLSCLRSELEARCLGTVASASRRDESLFANTGVCVLDFGRAPSDPVAGEFWRDVSATARLLGQVAPGALIVVASEPVDTLCWVMHRVSGLPKERVCGLGPVHTVNALKELFAAELDVDVRDVQIAAAGSDNWLVPVASRCSVGGVPLSLLVREGWTTYERLNALGDRLLLRIDERPDIVHAPGTATAIAEIVESYLRGRNRVLTVVTAGSAPGDPFVGVPAIIATQGVERRLPIDLPHGAHERMERLLEDARERLAAVPAELTLLE